MAKDPDVVVGGFSCGEATWLWQMPRRQVVNEATALE
jgi:hypothetical protein